MMGGGASLRQGGAQDSPPGWAGVDPGVASSPRNLGAGWTKMAALLIRGRLGGPVILGGDPQSRKVWGYGVWRVFCCL